MSRLSQRLPDFPWDKLTDAAALARSHPDGIVDLSIGTPVDPTPALIQDALAGAADSPGYPTTIRLEGTRQSVVDWLARRHGVTGLGLDGVLPETAQWKAHNYIHLMEQPTLFYAVCLTLAVLGQGGGVNAWLAWAYAGLRVLHSLVQATTNVIRFRFLLFALSSTALIGLTLRAAMAAF